MQVISDIKSNGENKLGAQRDSNGKWRSYFKSFHNVRQH